MEKKVGGSVESRRAAMPVVTAFVDMLRVAYGSELIDAQLATAQRARREYESLLAAKGLAAAERWRKANDHLCTFWAEEGGRTVGLRSAYGVQAPAQAGA